MNIIKKSLQLLALLVLPICVAFAGGLPPTNPIDSVLTQNFPKVVYTAGGTYVASYTFTSRMPWTMVNPLVIEKNSNSTTEFTYNDLCTGMKLAYLETCTVTIYLKKLPH